MSLVSLDAIDSTRYAWAPEEHSDNVRIFASFPEAVQAWLLGDCVPVLEALNRLLPGAADLSGRTLWGLLPDDVAARGRRAWLQGMVKLPVR